MWVIVDHRCQEQVELESGRGRPASPILGSGERRMPLTRVSSRARRVLYALDAAAMTETKIYLRLITGKYL